MKSKKKKRNKIIGIICLAGPISGLFIIFLSWAIINFVLTAIGVENGEPNTLVTIGLILQVFLGFFGVFSLIAIPIGLIAGVYFMSRD